MKEVALCSVCQNKNEVKVSSGHSNPANKGKKYFTCLNCDSFHWILNGVPTRPDNAPPPSLPSQNRPEQTELVSETIRMKDKEPWLNKEQVREPIKEVDWEDQKVRGMVRNTVAGVYIKVLEGIEPTPEIKEVMNLWVDWIMVGK